MLESILRDQCGLDPRKLVLVGVSGGPDSLCLLDILHSAGYPLIVAHFNHRLRPEADQEEAAVSALAHKLGLEFVSDSADVHSYAAAQALSLEEAARLLRYRFLFAAARRRSAQAVAVGHTADDQVETILMHFLRGAGLAGLKGMEHRTLLPVFDDSISLVRPILGLRRTETEAYCRDHGLQPHYDATNADQAYFRNRLRHSLVPELEKYNPRFKESILRMSAALQGDQALLQEIIDKEWKQTVVESGAGWFAFEASRLVSQSKAMRRNLIRQAAESLRPGDRDIGFEALQRAADFCETPEPKRIDFINGLYLFRESGSIYLAAYEADLPSVQWPQISAACKLVGPEMDLGSGWTLSVEENPATREDRSASAGNWSVSLDADQVTGGLSLRPPRPGDRFQSLGMASGSLKISDLFVNLKLPQRARKNWPLLCAGEQIVWVPGLRLAHSVRVTEATRRVLHLALKKT